MLLHSLTFAARNCNCRPGAKRCRNLPAFPHAPPCPGATPLAPRSTWHFDTRTPAAQDERYWAEHVEQSATEKEREKQRKVRVKAERERREQEEAERAQARPSSTPSSSKTRAPWPKGMPITGTADAAARARREADKSASLERVTQHTARRRQQEEERIQEDQRRMEARRVAELIQRGD